MAKVTSSVNYLNETNVKAFLKLIRYCEHDRREDLGVYYVLYGGGISQTGVRIRCLKERRYEIKTASFIRLREHIK